MIKFEKISLKQYLCDGGSEDSFEGIALPKRATAGSAGYDFFAPVSFTLSPGESIKILTGIRCKMDKDFALLIFPRSGLGFKYSLMLNNTVGIIDSDYYFADNEGHIQIKMTNRGDKVLNVEKGSAFAQGVFLKYYLTDDDDSSVQRKGGFGSTDNK
ncbi:MAG: dUTP diphosphatase [Clostridia bacterium]|nr:dUTP diphosphatase [Clostridia bacterium]MBP5648579.1 dUTP diphosphatase [Clostridia bacterium]